MNKRLIGVLMFALAVSGLATVVLYRLIASQMPKAREIVVSSKPVARARLLVATHNLVDGELIKSTDVTVADWTGPVPLSALTKLEDAVGRGVLEKIYSGEAILETRLAPRGAGAGLATLIPKGMRAVAVRVNDIVGVAGFVTPGSHVDILIAGNPPNHSNAEIGTVTKTLLQDMEVLSAGQNIQKDAEGRPITVTVVNLLVTPQQAEILSLASNETRIQLVLRNPLDKETVSTPGTAVAYLFNGKYEGDRKPSIQPAPRTTTAPVKPVAAPAPDPGYTVEVFLGAAKSVSRFAGEKGENPSTGAQQ